MESIQKPTPSNFCCNRDILKFFRTQRGWTQAELGRYAGYSERLISKAESGRSVSRTTITDLAEALSTSDQPVYFEDLVSDPIGIAEKYIAAVYACSHVTMSMIESFLDPEVVFFVAGEPDVVPFSGTYYGIEGCRELFRKFFSVLEVPQKHDHRPWYKFVGHGNDVIMWGKSWIHPIGMPMQEPMPVAQLFRFRKGKIVYMEDRFDTVKAIEIIPEYADRFKENQEIQAREDL